MMAFTSWANPEPIGVNPRRCLVHKMLSAGLTALLTLSAFACLLLAAGADISGPGG
jgi:hypothetical protein